MSNREQYHPFQKETLPSQEGKVVAVHLPKERPAELILSSWDDVVNTFHHFATDEFQKLPISAEQIAQEKQLRSEGKYTMPDYSNEDLRNFSNYYSSYLTNENHVQIMLASAKANFSNQKRYELNENSTYLGRLFREATIEVQQINVNNEDQLYMLKIKSEHFGNFFEEKLEETGIERAVLPKRIILEYPHKQNKFKVDFDDVSEKLQDVLQSDNALLHADGLVNRIVAINNDREKVISLGLHEGFSLKLHYLHDGDVRSVGKNMVEGNVERPLEGGWMPPCMEIRIASQGLWRKDYRGSMVQYPIISPRDREKAHDLAARIAEAFR